MKFFLTIRQNWKVKKRRLISSSEPNVSKKFLFWRNISLKVKLRTESCGINKKRNALLNFLKNVKWPCYIGIVLCVWVTTRLNLSKNWRLIASKFSHENWLNSTPSTTRFAPNVSRNAKTNAASSDEFNGPTVLSRFLTIVYFLFFVPIDNFK